MSSGLASSVDTSSKVESTRRQGYFLLLEALFLVSFCHLLSDSRNTFAEFPVACSDYNGTAACAVVDSYFRAEEFVAFCWWVLHYKVEGL